MKTLSILGATGSIGTQALDVVERFPDRWCVRWLTTNTRVDEVLQLAAKHRAHGVVIADVEAYAKMTSKHGFDGQILAGTEALLNAAADTANDIVLSALVGFAGVAPTVAAIEAGTDIALANKETLVSAGEYIMKLVEKHNVSMTPVDSEHSAIQQCLAGEELSMIERLILTASGGPFRGYSAEQLQHVTLEQALKHPNWDMGAKITIDSSTLMNKGFEVIEARWLFDIPGDRIDVYVHPGSIVHSFVEFKDGSMKAQLGQPDMRVAIQYALSWPERLAADYPRLSLAEMSNLQFFAPDTTAFPCLDLAFQCMEAGGTAATVLNAANEIAVHAFLNKQIQYKHIVQTISETLANIQSIHAASLPEIVAVDAEARRQAAAFVQAIS